MSDGQTNSRTLRGCKNAFEVVRLKASSPVWRGETEAVQIRYYESNRKLIGIIEAKIKAKLDEIWAGA